MRYWAFLALILMANKRAIFCGTNGLTAFPASLEGEPMQHSHSFLFCRVTKGAKL